MTAIVAIALAAAVIAAPAEPASAEICEPTTLADVYPDLYGSSTTTTEAADDDPGVDVDDPAPRGPTTSTQPPPACEPFVKAIQSPLPGGASIGSRFGADRDGGTRHHVGVDLAAPRMTPVLAVADGTIARINPSGTSITLRHTDGWSSRYVHLNNDRWGTDDGLGIGVVPGLAEGDRVVVGQVIGYVGDSTNAEETVPHLHFELLAPDGTPVDAAASVRAATEIPGFDGAFSDDDGLPAEPFLDWAASIGAVSACDELGLSVCPDTLLTPEVAEHIVAVVTGHAVTAPAGLADVEGVHLPTTRTVSGPELADMVRQARQVEFLETLSLNFGLGPVTDDEPVEPVLSVGCLWRPPATTFVSLADAVVAVLVGWGDATVPACTFTPPEA